MKTLVDFKGLKLELAAPDTIRSWSNGEIIKPETINYRTLKPEKDGLFCERIFGPTKDYECYCGKYKRIRFRGIICDKCGVEVTQSRVRRERMGHIVLASPVVHVWYFKGAPSQLSLLLGVSPKSLTRIIYFAQFVVLEVDDKEKQAVIKRIGDKLAKTLAELEGKTKVKIEEVKAESRRRILEVQTKNAQPEQRDLIIKEIQFKLKQDVVSVRENLAREKITAEEVYKTILVLAKKLQPLSMLTEDEYLKLSEYDATSHVKLGMGAESLEYLIQKINLSQLVYKLQQEVLASSGTIKLKKMKRLRVANGFLSAKLNPDWMLLRVLPVIPPDLRPMVQLSGGRFATSDLNDLYRRVINRNNRLKHLVALGAPDIILRNEKRMLQEAVDSLIDAPQSRSKRRTTRRELKSLSEMLKGKQGRFRQNLLGKRVDYSGRSVIVVGPELKLNQCGLPKDMALEMFKPYLLRELIVGGISPNVRSAKAALERRSPEVYNILENITKDHPVLLNRAPTLHKLGIQAFYPLLIEGNAIRIHPCVCAGFNADFDGDQMAVHVPLSIQAQKEAREMMMPEHNLLKPANGTPITVPNKEMAMGCYYLTSFDHKAAPAEVIFSGEEEVLTAFQVGKIGLRQPITVRISGKLIETTVGRIMFNQVLPQGRLEYVNRPVTAGVIQDLVREAINLLPREDTVNLIDAIKAIGFAGATISGLSVSVNDCVIIPEKDELIKEADHKAGKIEDSFNIGLITQEERRRLTNQLWMDVTDDIANKTWRALDPNNAVRLIIDSGGTRASRDQVKQLSAIRGLVVDPLGNIVEMPTKSNFRQGLSIFEYVTSTRGSRKGLTDSALKTADAGYLTRRLVDVAHDVILRMEDCGTNSGIAVSSEGRRGNQFAKRILGRILVKDVKIGKKIIARTGEIIDEKLQNMIIDGGNKSIIIRSPLTCEAIAGVCIKCYGWDFGTRKIANLGLPAGVIAAQSIGEPGTQLTMRVKHTGGVVGLDVTQGLPRVEELFEARTPKAVSPMTQIAGEIKIKETDRGTIITVFGADGIQEKHLVPATSQLQVTDGQKVPAGWQLTSGALDIDELVKIKGIKEAQDYLINQIQSIYESQGIQINDKHFEVIIRKMSDKMQITDPGDTNSLAGEMIDSLSLRMMNQKINARGDKPAKAKQTILGITRASLFTLSWLSAASFIETTRVLTQAAIEGAEDPLIGLKENVIIGRLIPTSPERAELESVDLEYLVKPESGISDVVSV
jgi:DNA-directed RNA polymerase subunit beta'